MESTGIEISEVRRQLSRYEPLLLMVLSIHGVFVLLLVTGGMPRHWLGLGVMLLLGMMAWRYPQISLRIRVTLFVLLTWFLLFSSGGVGSFFLLWYFVTVAFIRCCLIGPLI